VTSTLSCRLTIKITQEMTTQAKEEKCPSRSQTMDEEHWPRLLDDFVNIANSMSVQEKEIMIKNPESCIWWEGDERDSFIGYLRVNVLGIRCGGPDTVENATLSEAKLVQWLHSWDDKFYGSTVHLSAAWSIVKNLTYTYFPNLKMYGILVGRRPVYVQSEHPPEIFRRVLASSLSARWSELELGTLKSAKKIESVVRLQGSQEIPFPAEEFEVPITGSMIGFPEQVVGAYYEGDKVQVFRQTPATFLMGLFQSPRSLFVSDKKVREFLLSFFPNNTIGLLVYATLGEVTSAYYTESEDIPLLSLFGEGERESINLRAIWKRVDLEPGAIRAALQNGRASTEKHYDHYVAPEATHQLIKDAIRIGQQVFVLDTEGSYDAIDVKDWCLLHLNTGMIAEGVDEMSLKVHILTYDPKLEGLYLVKGAQRERMILLGQLNMRMELRAEGDKVSGILCVDRLLNPIWKRESRNHNHDAYVGVLQKAYLLHSLVFNELYLGFEILIKEKRFLPRWGDRSNAITLPKIRVKREGESRAQVDLDASQRRSEKKLSTSMGMTQPREELAILRSETALLIETSPMLVTRHLAWAEQYAKASHKEKFKMNPHKCHEGGSTREIDRQYPQLDERSRYIIFVEYLTRCLVKTDHEMYSSIAEYVKGIRTVTNSELSLPISPMTRSLMENFVETRDQGWFIRYKPINKVQKLIEAITNGEPPKKKVFFGDDEVPEPLTFEERLITGMYPSVIPEESGKLHDMPELVELPSSSLYLFAPSSADLTRFDAEPARSWIDLIKTEMNKIDEREYPGASNGIIGLQSENEHPKVFVGVGGALEEDEDNADEESSSKEVDEDDQEKSMK
jgi:hypothetical protein